MRAGDTLTEHFGLTDGVANCLDGRQWDHTDVHFTGEHVATPGVAAVTLTKEGLWAVQLVVQDAAGNRRTARRFVMYHASSQIEVSKRAELLLTSAGDNGRLRHDDSELWQTQSSTGVTATWDGLFAAPATKGWLNPSDRVGVPGLEPGYDQRDGQAVNDVRPSGTPNNEGVTLFTVQLLCTSGADDIWPESLKVTAAGVQPTSVPHAIEGVPSTQLAEEVAFVNGHFYNLIVRAHDTYSNSVERAVTVGVDVTPPELVNWGIQRDGEQMLAVHNLDDISSMRLTFHAFDTESGLRHIKWRLFEHLPDRPSDVDSASPLVAEDSIAVKPVNATECAALGNGKCVCTVAQHFCFLRGYEFPVKDHLVLVAGDLDRHAQNFTFVLEVTNRAGLTTTQTLVTLVDLTPPSAAGAAVLEGVGATDSDYQQSMEVHVRFHGFVDPESGIRNYAWAVGPECLGGGSVIQPSDVAFANFTMLRSLDRQAARQVSGTTSKDVAATHDPGHTNVDEPDTLLKWQAPGAGRFVFSVIAFNNAFSPSSVVCSDGITVDPTTAVRPVDWHMANTWTRHGLALHAGAVHAIFEDMTRVEVAAPVPGGCVAAATPLDDISPFRPRLRPGANTDSTVQPWWARGPAQLAFPMAAAEACLLPPYVQEYFQAAENVVNASWHWQGIAGGLREFQVGLASTGPTLHNPTPEPDIMAYRSTAKQGSFLSAHTDLDAGVTFFVLLKISQRNGAAGVFPFGPVLVDSRPPLMGSLALTHNGNSLTANWTGFSNPTVAGGALLSFFIGAGLDNATAPDGLVAFRRVRPTEEHCPPGVHPGACASLPYAALSGRGAYQIALKTCTGSMRCGVVFSPVLAAVPISAPGVGVVFDQAPGTAAPSSADVDFQVSATEVQARWFNFGHTVLEEIEYELGLGTAPNITDVAPFVSFGTAHGGTLTGLPLREGVRYYAQVRASNRIGSVVAASDGVTVAAVGRSLRPLAVYDGPGCVEPAAANLLAAPAPPVAVQAGGSAVRVPLDGAAQPGLPYTITVQINASACLDCGYLEVRAGNKAISIPVGAVASVAGNCSCGNGTTSGQTLYAGSSECYCTLEGAVAVTAAGTVAVWEVGFVADGVGLAVELLLQAPNDTSVDVTIAALSHCANDIAAIAVNALAGGTVSAWWRDASDVEGMVTHYSVGLAAVGPTPAEQIQEWPLEFRPVGSDTAATIALDEPLTAGQRYAFAVRPCNAAGCYNASFSSGFVATDGEPDGGFMSAEYSQDHLASQLDNTDVHLQFETFAYAYAISMYTWTLAKSADGAGRLTAWRSIVLSADGTVATSSDAALQTAVTAAVETGAAPIISVIGTLAGVDLSSVDFGRQLYAVVRGYGSDGEYGTASAPLRAATALPAERQVPVLDLVRRDDAGDVLDREVTDSRDTIAAAWPELFPLLRADFWDYSITTQRGFLDCAAADVGVALDCGRVFGDRFVEVTGLPMRDGETYYVCIKIGTVTLRSGGVVPGPRNPVSCSNGILADWSPPVAGTVVIGRPQADATDAGQPHEVFLTDAATVHLRWFGFLDAQEAGLEHHPTGIHHYSVQLGSGPGLADAAAQLDVGDSDHTVVSGLALRSGHSYVATVTAYDFAGRATAAASVPTMVDLTGPAISRVTVTQGLRTAGDVHLAVSWVATDAESGVRTCAWAVGNSPLHADVSAFQAAALPGGAGGDVALAEGQRFHATVRCSNHAGLSSDTATAEHIASADPPTPPVVSDGSEDGTDLEYQTSNSALHARWTAARHPVGVASQAWSIGTRPLASDVLGWTETGLHRAASATNLHLLEGQRYHVNVRACTAAGHCSEAASDGVVVDTSGPRAGVVLDGDHALDMDSQARAQGVSASWTGFADHESGIAGYSWCIGSARTACDLQPLTYVGGVTRAINTELALPATGERRYVSVRAFNGNHQHVDAHSDGIALDSDPPTVVGGPTLAVYAELVAGTQVAGSVLQGAWAFADNGAAAQALRYTYTLEAHHDGAAAVVLEARGDEDGFRLPGLALADGDTYFLTATACDEANLCTAATTSQGLLVDTTPPARGFFVDSLLWYAADAGAPAGSVTLVWDGFFEPHSAVDTYEVSVGTAWNDASLLPVVTFAPPLANETERGEQTFALAASVAPGSTVHLTLRARNSVGLWSDIVRVSARALALDVLQILVHSCSAVACGALCTCGPYSRCFRQALLPCAAEPASIAVQVLDGFVAGVDADVQIENVVLGASWTGTAGLRVEYTAGIRGSKPGSGVFRPGSPEMEFWVDAGFAEQAVVHAVAGPLLHGTTYVFYLRVYTGDGAYQQFASDGVAIHVLPPAAQVRWPGEHDLLGTAGGELDAVADGSGVLLSWAGVFSGDVAGYGYWFGTRPGHSDMVPRTDAGTDTEARLDVQLQPHQRYYATVRATSSVGLRASRSSDGIMWDTTPPLPGSVFDGDGPEEVETQAAADVVTASWRGFQDADSGVASYLAGVGTTPGGFDVVPQEAVGFNTAKSWTVAGGLQAGATYYTTVVARDAVGLESLPVTSDGVRVDLTPPTGGRCPVLTASDAENLVQDPSFAHNPVRPTDSHTDGPACEADSGTAAYALLRNASTLPALSHEGLAPVCIVSANNATRFELRCNFAEVRQLDVTALEFVVQCAATNGSLECALVGPADVDEDTLPTTVGGDGINCSVSRDGNHKLPGVRCLVAPELRPEGLRGLSLAQLRQPAAEGKGGAAWLSPSATLQLEPITGTGSTTSLLAVPETVRLVSVAVACTPANGSDGSIAKVSFQLYEGDSDVVLARSDVAACRSDGWTSNFVAFVPGTGGLPLLSAASRYRVVHTAVSGAFQLVASPACGPGGIVLRTTVVPMVYGKWVASAEAGDWQHNGESGSHGLHSFALAALPWTYPEGQVWLWQDVATRTGTTYSLSFYASVASIVGGVRAAGMVAAPGLSRTFVVTHASQHDSFTWRRIETHFVAAGSLSTIRIAGVQHVGGGARLLVDDFVVVPCNTGAAGGDVGSAGPPFQSSLSEISAHWLAEDQESGIAETLWVQPPSLRPPHACRPLLAAPPRLLRSPCPFGGSITLAPCPYGRSTTLAPCPYGRSTTLVPCPYGRSTTLVPCPYGRSITLAPCPGTC